MGKGSNIVHQYFKGDFEDFTVLVKLNPFELSGQEIIRYRDGKVQIRDLDFDENILDDLKADGFVEANPLEFNLYLSGLIS